MGNIFTLAIMAILILNFYINYLAKPGDSIGTPAAHPDYYLVAIVITAILGILCMFFAYKKNSYYFAFGPIVAAFIFWAHNIVYYLTH
jgi:hypothetical protein